MSYAQYFAIEKQLQKLGFTNDRADLISQFTDDMKDSLKALTDGEYKSFCGWLNETFIQPTAPRFEDSEAETRQRRTIIALFCKMGYLMADKADMVRINNWCKSHGHLHKPLNSYHDADLTKLVSQARAVYESFIQTK